MSEMLDRMNALMRDLKPQPRLEVRCGRAARDALLSGVPTATQPAAPLLGIPIYLDPELTDGAWKLLADGEVAHSGDMAPGHRRAIYVGGAGMIGLSDEIADLVWGNVDRARGQ